MNPTISSALGIPDQYGDLIVCLIAVALTFWVVFGTEWHRRQK